MTIVLSAVAPIFGLISLGYLLRRFILKSDSLWGRAERITYYILFPALLVSKLTLNNTTETPLASIATVVFPLIGIGTAVLFLLKTWMQFPDQEFTSIYQGGIRFNSYVGLAVAQQIFGDEGLTVAAVLIAFMIPTINVLSVLILSVYGNDNKPSPAAVISQMLRNPLILACFFGIVLNATEIGLPFGTDRILIPLGKIAVVVGLLVVGSGLHLQLIIQAKRPVFSSTLFKLAFMPMVAAALVFWSGLDGIPASMIVTFAGLPTASSAFILARQMGGNADLMAVIISFQTLVSTGSLPLLLLTQI
ncbi:MAG: transporter [Candidatus Marinimicrobia bacterium]|nr:transporter [Candidatus Neomarinimicrobiota bacterium]|tara:strand:+ start:9328 stop:10242 length:915 start_codon:yes stop_codon:yes gene_type:complete